MALRNLLKFFLEMIRENALAKTEHLTFIDMQKGIIYVKLNLCNSYSKYQKKATH